MNDLISRFDWNELPEKGQAFFVFAFNTAFIRKGNTMVEKGTRVPYPLPIKGAWYPLPPDPPTQPFKHWCSLWQPTYHNEHDRAQNTDPLWWGDGNGRYRWYPEKGPSDTLNGRLLDRQAAPENRTLGTFNTLKAAQKAAYEHFMQENWKDAA